MEYQPTTFDVWHQILAPNSTVVQEREEKLGPINWEDTREEMDETRFIEAVVAFTTDVIENDVRKSSSASVSAEHVEKAIRLATQVVYERSTLDDAERIADEAAARAAIAVGQLPGSSSEVSKAAMDSQNIAKISQDTLTQLMLADMELSIDMLGSI